MTNYSGPERRLRPRPVSTFQRLMDISFNAARKLESTGTKVPPSTIDKKKKEE
jgi:hypothetical protein